VLAHILALFLATEHPAPLDVAMAMHRCANITEIWVESDDSWPGLFFSTDTLVGGWLGTTWESINWSVGDELYQHPRRESVTLRFHELSPDSAQYELIRANRDAIVACYVSVL
jgi:hypothetical protein